MGIDQNKITPLTLVRQYILVERCQFEYEVDHTINFILKPCGYRPTVTKFLRLSTSAWRSESHGFPANADRPANAIRAGLGGLRHAPIRPRVGISHVYVRSDMQPSPDGRTRKLYWPEIGLPSLNLVFIRAQAPPGAPLRNGSIVSTNSSPGLSDLADMPSRARMLGEGPSRFHTVLAPSFPLTSTRIKLCGLVYRNSTTVPAISIEC